MVDMLAMDHLRNDNGLSAATQYSTTSNQVREIETPFYPVTSNHGDMTFPGVRITLHEYWPQRDKLVRGLHFP